MFILRMLGTQAKAGNLAPGLVMHPLRTISMFFPPCCFKSMVWLEPLGQVHLVSLGVPAVCATDFGGTPFFAGRCELACYASVNNTERFNACHIRMVAEGS